MYLPSAPTATVASPEGCRRCEKCDREGKGVYFCHAGLIDFGIELKIGDEVVGSVIGGQVLSETPDKASFAAWIHAWFGPLDNLAANFADGLPLPSDTPENCFGA